MDALNPMIASRLVEPLCNWGKYTPDHQTMMIEALQRISNERGTDISVPLKERLVKSLPQQTAPKTAASFNAAPVTPAP
jgi:hypothetical protein